eukprot:tig00000950_g5758.t1
MAEPPLIWPPDLGGAKLDLPLWMAPRDCDEALKQLTEGLFSYCTRLHNTSVPEGTVGTNIGALGGLDIELAACVLSSELAFAAFKGDAARVAEQLATAVAGTAGDAHSVRGAADRAAQLDLALAAASAGGRREIVAQLLEAGAAVDAGHGRALLLAVYAGTYAGCIKTRHAQSRLGAYIETVDQLVRSGACPKQRDRFPMTK